MPTAGGGRPGVAPRRPLVAGVETVALASTGRVRRVPLVTLEPIGSSEDLRRGLPSTLASEAGWVASEFCYLDPAWNDKGVSIIERAMRQINNNLDIVEDWFDLTGLDGYCTVNLLSANGTGGYLHFRRDRSEIHACGFGGTGWRGCTVPGSNTVTLSKEYVNAIANDYNDLTSDSTGRRACLVADLASTIVHETLHACFYLTEDYCNLIQQFYRDEFTSRHGYTSSNCCQANLSSYDPADYDGADDVAAVERMMTYDEVDGKWRTTGCS